LDPAVSVKLDTILFWDYAYLAIQIAAMIQTPKCVIAMQAIMAIIYNVTPAINHVLPANNPEIITVCHVPKALFFKTESAN